MRLTMSIFNVAFVFCTIALLPYLLLAIDYQAEDVAFKSGEEIVTLRKFRHESHTIKTPDSYFLHAMRIINPLIERPYKSPVLFVHGVLLSMTSFLVNSRGMHPRKYKSRCSLRSGEIIDLNDLRSLPLALSNNGYDVWMLNVRGVGLSASNVNLKPEEPAFWRYNLDILAANDLPATVSYILNVTGSPTIGYVAHSQGSFLMFAALTDIPELNNILKPAVAMAPVAFVNNLSGLCNDYTLYEHIKFQMNNHTDGCALNIPNLRQTFYNICKSEPKFCNYMTTITNGQSDMDAYPVGYISHLGFPTASRIVNHYYQLAHYTQFSRYDFGQAGNLQFYGQSRAPNYNPAKITNKYLVFVVGETDLLSALNDSRRLILEMRVPLYKEIFLSRPANHMDMLVSESANTRVNRPLLELFESLNGC